MIPHDDHGRGAARRLAHAARLGLPALLTAVPVVLGVVVLLRVPYVLDWRFGSDTLLLLDGAWRVVEGQRQHVDFHCAYGVFHHLLFALGLRWLGYDALSLNRVVALWSALAFVWSYSLARSRLRPLSASAYALLVAATAMGQNQLGYAFSDLSHSAYYNRLGFTLLLVFLVSLWPSAEIRERARSSRVRELLGPVSAGVALTLAVFTKVSYAVIMLGALAVTVWWRRPRPRHLVALGLAALCTTAAIAPSFGWRFDHVLSDYMQGAATRLHAHDASFGLGKILFGLPVRDLDVTWARVIEILRNDYLDLMALAVVVFTMRGRSCLASTWHRSALFVATATASLLLVLGNWQWGASPLPAAVALLVAGGRPGGSRANVAARWTSVGAALPHVAVAAASLAYLVVSGETFKGTRYAAPPLRPLMTSGHDGQCDPEQFAERIEEVVSFIRWMKSDSPPRVATLDFANPYPFALELAPPVGVAVALQVGATFREETFQPLKAVGDADVIVTHRCPLNVYTAPVLQRALQGYLDKEFESHALPHATVYVKRHAP